MSDVIKISYALRKKPIRLFYTKLVICRLPLEQTGLN